MSNATAELGEPNIKGPLTSSNAKGPVPDVSEGPFTGVKGPVPKRVVEMIGWVEEIKKAMASDGGDFSLVKKRSHNAAMASPHSTTGFGENMLAKFKQAAPDAQHVADQILTVSIAVAESNGTEMELFTEDVKSSATKYRNSPAEWENMIRKRGELAKDNVCAQIDAVTSTIRDSIIMLPEAQQDAAASLFESAFDLVVDAFYALICGIKEAAGNVWAYMSGLWEALATSYKAVMVAVNGAIISIKTLFRETHSSATQWQEFEELLGRSQAADDRLNKLLDGGNVGS
jgi:hypothetical protein